MNKSSLGSVRASTGSIMDGHRCSVPFSDDHLNDGFHAYGVVTLQVCHGIDRSVVNWDLVNMDPRTEDEKINNAKYAISVARKMGASVFCASEDIVQVSERSAQGVWALGPFHRTLLQMRNVDSHEERVE